MSFHGSSNRAGPGRPKPCSTSGGLFVPPPAALAARSAAPLATVESDTSNSSSIPSDEVDALRTVVEGTAGKTGKEFFASLVQNLARAIDVRYVFIAEFADRLPGNPSEPGSLRVRTLAYWAADHLHDDVEFDLAGTPCEEVVHGNLCHHPTNVSKLFPADVALVQMGIESYLGVPLKDHEGRHLGHLAVFDQRPMSPEPRRLYTFRIFADRAAAELERLRAERLLRESEYRFRELYDLAPIAYIYEDTSSRFLHANKAALTLLGIEPSEVPGFMGLSLIPDLPAAQRKIRRAIEDLQHGREQRAVELELRRHDNGQPIWVQWWSKPDPNGKTTRTMLVDITARVLTEREKARLQQQNEYLQEEIKSVHNFEEIVGRSAGLSAALDSVRRVATTDSTVLITGETGTGKELIARAIHSASNRRDRPLIKVNCAALPTGLVESELFGHERGAFSGAIAKRLGRFELANGGTLFLDEVGEIPLDIQGKLLRVLQEREFERVGGTGPIRADVRVITATNRDLAAAVRAGTFRQDLFYRLNVFPIQIPPLRQRTADIPLLVQFLLAKFQSRLGKRLEGVTPQSMKRLVAYPWPGNVRELENVIERAAILSHAGVLEIDPAALVPAAPPTTPAASPQPGADGESLEAVERNHILSVLDSTNWVIEGPRGAAKVLNLHPNTLRSRLKRLQIRRSTAR